MTKFLSEKISAIVETSILTAAENIQRQRRVARA